jgi:hypothetical protein
MLPQSVYVELVCIQSRSPTSVSHAAFLRVQY